jgi:hypothetical protein
LGFVVVFLLFVFPPNMAKTPKPAAPTPGSASTDPAQHTKINPFHGDSHEISSYNYAMIVFWIVTLLLPVRAIILILVFIIGNSCFWIVTIGLKFNDKALSIPLSASRRAMAGVGRLMIRVLLLALGFLHVRVKGSLAHDV